MARVGEQQQFLGPLAGGVAAGLASSMVRVPTEVVKTRMQTGGRPGGGLLCRDRWPAALQRRVCCKVGVSCPWSAGPYPARHGSLPGTPSLKWGLAHA